ncbi:MAG: transcriptional regulator [Sphingomicrobium sp.]
MAGKFLGGGFRFERFVLDPGNRQLTRDGAPVELNARYLDALVLLVREAGKLVSKDRFLDEVWRGVPVTDEALTQCITTLRRLLGDSAANPRLIETVPKHGYRFIAPVDVVADDRGTAGQATPRYGWRQFLLLGGAGTIGAGVAGIAGGLFYGFIGAAHPLAPGMGAASVLLVLMWLTIAAALIGGAGVSFGIAAAGFVPARQWSIVGGAVGGLVVGGAVKLLGLDAFNLLLGRSPGDITGGVEGLLLGGAVGVGAWLASRVGAAASLRRGVVSAGAAGAAVGILIPLLGGRLMGGSLDLLARHFPSSQLRLDQIGSLFGERGFGPISQVVTGGAEGFLFSGCIVGAMIVARRSLSEPG